VPLSDPPLVWKSRSLAPEMFLTVRQIPATVHCSRTHGNGPWHPISASITTVKLAHTKLKKFNRMADIIH